MGRSGSFEAWADLGLTSRTLGQLQCQILSLTIIGYNPARSTSCSIALCNSDKAVRMWRNCRLESEASSQPRLTIILKALYIHPDTGAA